VHDHESQPARHRPHAQALEPADAHLLHVAEIDGVVHMAHRVHVSPADRNLHPEDEHSPVAALAHHAPKPSSAVTTAALMKSDLSEARSSRTPSRSSGAPSRLRGNIPISLRPPSVSQ